MARSFSQALIRVSTTTGGASIQSRKLPVMTGSRFVNHRNRSNRSEKTQLIEVELDPETEGEVLGMRRLEDAIHGIIVRRSAPDWLPFIPGSSYWVPPRKRPLQFIELLGKFPKPMTEEETLSLMTLRGWPSSTYYVEGASHPVENEPYFIKASQSEDQEGASHPVENESYLVKASQSEDEEG